MSQYIDGFSFPISNERLDDYRLLAEEVAKIWIEHGALDYCEYVVDDEILEGTRSFAEVLAASENETVVIGWVVFDSRETRDAVNIKVAADARMSTLVEAANSGFDATRMAYGGFRALIQASGSSDGGLTT